MSQTAPYSASFAQLHTRLALYGIEVTPSVRQRRTEPEVYGVVFAKDGHRMKGSEVGKAFSASNLQKVFAQHEAQAPVLDRAVGQVAQGYSAEALSRLFAQQAQEEAQKSPETARQQMPLPDRRRNQELEM